MSVQFEQIKPINRNTLTRDMAMKAAALVSMCNEYKKPEYVKHIRVDNNIDGGVTIITLEHLVIIYADGRAMAYHNESHEIETPCNQLEWTKYLIEWGFFSIQWVSDEQPIEHIEEVTGEEVF
jgi:hypothetical protein